MKELFSTAARCIEAADVDEKIVLTRAAAEQWRAGALDQDRSMPVHPIAEPGRPARPQLVSPRHLPRRSFHTPVGYAALIHSLAHIEFNAINLAWDAVYRFREFPREYYNDWVNVAEEEAYHFELLRQHLRGLGYDYGDFDAHDGLWDMAGRTADDALLRLAVVPRGLEARGLDVTPAMIERVRARGDGRAAEILEIILRDEIGHVEAGTRWFRYLCAERGLDAEATFREMVQQFMSGRVKAPLNTAARKQAGFSDAELDYLSDEAGE